MDLRYRVYRGPDTAMGLTQHFGLSPRWLDTFLSVCSGIVVARAAQRWQLGMRYRGLRRRRYNMSIRSARCCPLFPFAQGRGLSLRIGGANASFALITKHT